MDNLERVENIVVAKDIVLAYKEDEPIIQGCSFGIKAKDFVFITGPSGSGKTTLLRSLYGGLFVKGGELSVCGVELKKGTRSSKLNLLRRHIGIVFQDYKLIKEWNVEKNIILPLLINGYSNEVCSAQTERLLAHVKLSHKATKFPLELSGGEQQRIAMARALAHNPMLILADEPTGNLDDYSSEVIWNLLRSANEQLGMTVVVVTHRVPTSLGIPHRHLNIEDGLIYEIS